MCTFCRLTPRTTVSSAALTVSGEKKKEGEKSVSVWRSRRVFRRAGDLLPSQKSGGNQVGGRGNGGGTTTLSTTAPLETAMKSSAGSSKKKGRGGRLLPSRPALGGERKGGGKNHRTRGADF